MTPRKTLLPAGISALALAATAAGVILLRGAEPPALRGLALGAGLGAVGAVFEAVLVVRGLALPRGHALRVVIAGFGIRLAVLATGAILLRDGAFADPAAFAVSFVGAFLAGVPVLAAAAAAPGTRTGLEAR